MSKPVELGSLRVGSYIVLDGEPCKIVEFEKSKPGKHGSAKVRVVGIGLFSDSKKSYVSPAESQVEVPIIEKRSGQVIALMQNSVQLMDLETFEVFETDMPKEEELKKNLTQGVEVEYWRVLGRTKIMRIKG